MSWEQRRIYLDANAIIHFAEHPHSPVVALCLRAPALGLSLFTSELSLSEVLVMPLRQRDAELVSAYKAFLRSDPTVTVVPIDRDILERSAELRAHVGGKTPDAIHCATAELLSCGIVVSSDKRLRLPDGLRRVDVEAASLIGWDR